MEAIGHGRGNRTKQEPGREAIAQVWDNIAECMQCVWRGLGLGLRLPVFWPVRWPAEYPAYPPVTLNTHGYPGT